MTDATQPTEPLVPSAPAPAPPPRRRRRGMWAAIWIAISLVALVVVYFVADGLVRAYAQNQVAAQIEQNFPDSVKGDVTAHIGGTSVIAQYLSGSFEQVTLDAPKLTFEGIPLSASVVANGVPADLTKPVSNIAGTITISQSSINSLLKLPGATGDLVLGDGTVQYDGTTKVLGLPIGYTVTVEPTAAGDSIDLQPTKAEVKAGGGNLDLSKLLGAVVSKPLSVCVAQYLPAGVQVDDVTVHPGEATIHLTAHDLVLSQDTLATKGTCS
ncbi:DUF2993 domain-containing protein [Diaminobutyricibacter sp. McL0618]|uniref:LmeA family phospholipid-binding protein n=1 Tax=Leifsonia sp. McL0618 TaxID=3415677 RepID=UPI003CF28B31